MATEEASKQICEKINSNVDKFKAEIVPLIEKAWDAETLPQDQRDEIADGLAKKLIDILERYKQFIDEVSTEIVYEYGR